MNFEDFKEGFVIVLSDAIDGLTASSAEEQGTFSTMYLKQFMCGDITSPDTTCFIYLTFAVKFRFSSENSLYSLKSP